jgi:hypothetical protein
MKKAKRLDPRRGRPRTANRPEISDDRPQGILFSTQGSTGWGRRRNLGDYKGNKRKATLATCTISSGEKEMSLYE